MTFGEVSAALNFFRETTSSRLARTFVLFATPPVGEQPPAPQPPQPFPEGAKIAFQQGGKNIEPVDVSQADRGRKNEGDGPAYRSRFTARFAYDTFDPNAKTKVFVIFPDGKMTEIDADFSKVK